MMDGAPTDVSPGQRVLGAEEIQAFYHDLFVEGQLGQFGRLVDSAPKRVVDMGGGCGYFARALMARTAHTVRVVDMDPQSIDECRRAGVEAEVGDALRPRVDGVDVVSFNMILHHLVAGDEAGTRALQSQALGAWRGHADIFVNEYIYESWFGDLSGWLIYQVTKSRLLSALAGVAARLAPSLRANTFGTGVRFRSDAAWRRLFAECGLRVVAHEPGRREKVALPRKLLLIRETRQDGYLLRAA